MRSHKRASLAACALALTIIGAATPAAAGFRLEYVPGLEPTDGIAVARQTAAADEIGYAGREARVSVTVAPPRIQHGGCYVEPGTPPLDVLQDENTNGDPTIENPSPTSSASGCWQMILSTSNDVAIAIGRPDLVGVPAGEWPVETQNEGAIYLWAGGAGCSHWEQTSEEC